MPVMWKLGTGLAVGAVGIVADIAADAQNWEALTAKGLLIAAVVILGYAVLHLVKYIAKKDEEHRLEIKAIWEQHNKEAEEREKALQAALDNNARSMAILSQLTQEQTEFFRDYTKTIVRDHIQLQSGPRGAVVAK